MLVRSVRQSDDFLACGCSVLVFGLEAERFDRLLFKLIRELGEGMNDRDHQGWALAMRTIK